MWSTEQDQKSQTGREGLCVIVSVPPQWYRMFVCVRQNFVDGWQAGQAFSRCCTYGRYHVSLVDQQAIIKAIFSVLMRRPEWCRGCMHVEAEVTSHSLQVPTIIEDEYPHFHAQCLIPAPGDCISSLCQGSE